MAEFQDKEALLQAIRRVRNDADEADWVLATYVDGVKLGLVGVGTGGVPALAEHLSEDNIFYGMVRVIELIDGSETVKFAYVELVGSKVKPLFKGKVMMKRSSVVALFDPFHVNLETSNLEDVNEERIRAMVAKASMAANNVLQEAVSSKTISNPQHALRPPPVVKSVVTPAGSGTGWAAPKVTSSSSSVQFVNQEEIEDAILKVKSDATDINWVLLQFTGRAEVSLVGYGNGGTEELKTHLTDDGIYYGLIRVIEMIDGSETVKFAYVNWVGTSVKPMVRGRHTTNHGAIQDMIRKIQIFHVDFVISSLDEISEEIVAEKVGNASMARSRVL